MDRTDWQGIADGLELGGGTVRARLVARGRVQGVGFRPSVFRYAVEENLAGFVRNTRLGVVIEVEGPRESVDRFALRLLGEPPPLARIDELDAEAVPPAGGGRFVILESEEPGRAEALFPVDTAVCADCLREMRDPADPRFRYPFINCTNCGPRFTIIEGLPYDRPLTTMRRFEMDGLCRGQYADPGDRRFHAEPISCPNCGPRLFLVGEEGRELDGDPVTETRRLLEAGFIVAVKGLGGYHFACRADRGETVGLLRLRKSRPAKPFAVMFRDLSVAEQYCRIGDTERALLLSPEAPIVILRRRDHHLPESIAPGNACIGAFLPYTPVHHLLMETFDALVMTSANLSDEPLISTEEEIAGLLGPIADAALENDRPIAHKCDDSIVFAPGGLAVPIRRARGFVPEPVPLPMPPAICILATGGQEKGTFALSRGGSAFLSPHLGDLGDWRGQRNYRGELEEYERILGISAEAVVHDMHPDYFTTRFAAQLGLPTFAVQHHHAHAVSVMVEHGIVDPVVAVCFDGTGFGTDGTLWGGEFLLAEFHRFERLAHLAVVPLAGGEAAIREPWRMALVHLRRWRGDALAGDDLGRWGIPPDAPVETILELVDRGVNAIPTSSIGRFFDAVASMLDLGARVSYEAEAAVALEAAALESNDGGLYRFGSSGTGPIVVDPTPVVAAVAADIDRNVSVPAIARRFHRGVAAMIVETAGRLAAATHRGTVVCSGGVFQNRLLCEDVMALSAGDGLDWRWHAIVPPNDGGVSLGQLQAAAAMIAHGEDGAADVPGKERQR
ncbi:MAG: carbamoyltransferase HypF [Candidatus Krumholzibacteriota bacterium]|nr:carbamoyltransferase HypF [Candidatus Krumholzibacteriota bacterium]